MMDMFKDSNDQNYSCIKMYYFLFFFLFFFSSFCSGIHTNGWKHLTHVGFGDSDLAISTVQKKQQPRNHFA